MPQLDASLFSGYQPITPPDQVNMLAKYLQLSGAQQQNQSGALQLQQAQQSADETNRLRQLFADPTTSTLDPNALRSRIMGVAPIAGQPILKTMLDTQKTQGEIQKTSLDNEHQQIVQTGGQLGAAAAIGPQAVLDVITKSPVIPEAHRAGMLAMAQADPIAYAKQFVQGALTPDQQAQLTKQQFLPTEQGIAAVRPTLDGSPASGYMVGNVQGAASSRTGQPGVGPGLPAGYAPTLPPGSTPPPGSQSVDWGATLKSALDDPNPAIRQEAKARLVAMGTPLGDAGPNGPAAPPAVASTAPPTPPPATPVLPLGAKSPGKWEHDPLNGNFVYLPNNAPIGATAGSGSDALISKGAIDNAAARYNLDGTLPPMGMGAAGSQGRKQILDRAAELAQGTNGTDQRINQLDAKGTASALASLTKQQAAISAFEKTANDNAQMALDMSNKLDRTGIPILNAGLQFARTNTGSPEAAQFHAAVATFVGEYAKVMSGGSGGGPTSDAARAKAGSLLTENMTQPQFAAVVKTLQQEMDNRMSGFNSQASELRARMRGQNVSTNGAALSSPAGWTVTQVP